MRAHFFWPQCTYDMAKQAWNRVSRGVFWVSVSPEEVEQHMEPLMTPEAWAAYEDLSEVEIEDSYLVAGKFYFFVPYRVSQHDPPVLGLAVYPHSGMWNGRRPWFALGPPKPDHPYHEPEGIEVANLSDLEPLRYSIHSFHLVADRVHRTA